MNEGKTDLKVGQTIIYKTGFYYYEDASQKEPTAYGFTGEAMTWILADFALMLSVGSATVLTAASYLF